MRSIFIFLLLLQPLTASAQQCPRIISQSPYITHTLEWMGLKPCIVGTSRYEELGLPTTGGVLDPDADAIDALQPDLFLSSDWITEEALRQATPEQAHALRLHGFQSMAQVEENIRRIALASGRRDLLPLAESFKLQWHRAAAGIKGKGHRVLLISSCSGAPYSFGRNSWLYELFTQAGFEVVETAERIRLIQPGKEISEINQLLDHYRPELLFIFERKQSPQCKMLRPKTRLRIYSLDGEHFLHPAPVLLKGLEDLSKLNRYL